MTVRDSKELPTTECLAPAQIEAKVEAAQSVEDVEAA